MKGLPREMPISPEITDKGALLFRTSSFGVGSLFIRKKGLSVRLLWHNGPRGLRKPHALGMKEASFRNAGGEGPFVTIY